MKHGLSPRLRRRTAYTFGAVRRDLARRLLLIEKADASSSLAPAPAASLSGQPASYAHIQGAYARDGSRHLTVGVPRGTS